MGILLLGFSYSAFAVEPYNPQSLEFYGRTDTVDESVGSSLPIDAGLFTIDVKWMFEPSRGADVIRGKVTFLPDATAPTCSSISFIQTARLDLELRGDSIWDGAESARESMKTERDAARGVLENYFIDHEVGGSLPGSYKSPFFRDSWPSVSESGDGSVDSTGKVVAASLVDYPYGWDSSFGMDRISLESCAICRVSGHIYGCVQWGAQRPLGAGSSRSVFYPRATSSPSATFRGALKLFLKFYRPTQS